MPTVPSSSLGSWIAVVLLWGAALLAYHDVGSSAFVWDDFDNIVHNDELRNLAGLGRIWTEPSSGIQFFPVWNTTLWLLWRIDGANPAVYTIAGACLHALASALLFLVARRFLRLGATERPSPVTSVIAWVAALWFAVHPVHVESIAWATELKNTTSVVLLLLALFVHLGKVDASVDAPETTEHRSHGWTRYAGTLSLTALAILAKPTTVVLVPLLMLVNQARGRQWRETTRRHLPHLILGLAFAWFTAVHEREHIGAMGSTFARSVLERIAVAGHVFWFHVRQLLLLEPTMFFHPRFDVHGSAFGTWFPTLLACVACSTPFLLRGRARWIATTCLGTYLLFLLPTSGLFTFYFLRYGDVQDHFGYLPSLPLFVLFAWLLVRACQTLLREPHQAAGLAVGSACAACLLLIPRTWKHLGAFTSEEALWRDAIAQNDEAYAAHLNLSNLLASRGDLEGSIRHARRSVEIDPNQTESQGNLGKLLAQVGRAEEALPHLERALASRKSVPPQELSPGDVDLWFTHGILSNALGHHAEAIEDLDIVLAVRPQDANAHFAKGSSHLARQEADLAAWHLERACRLQPSDVDAWTLLGSAHALLGEGSQARDAWETGLRVATNRGDAERARLLREALAQLPR